ncbi:uncharacterized protein [Hetaerina americana]|uniref:uncharacterized protein n=1 Tax=Hetaerina americana TaxID=62018 RepID=UPI003A7F12FF
MDEQVKTTQHPESQQLCPQTVGVKERQKDDHGLVLKSQLPLIPKEVDNTKVSSAVSVVLDGLNASLIFPPRTGGDELVNFQLEGNKNILHSDGCKFEGSLLFSQTHPLVEVLQEILRPSSGSLQIILESPNVAESTPESNVNLVGANFTSKEIINDAKNAHQSHELHRDEIVDRGAQGKKEWGSVSDSSKKTDSLSMVQLIHKCCYCRFRSETVAVVLEHVRKKHPGKPAKTKVISGRDCPYCGLRLDQTAFFQHMRQFHEDSHPYRCGYCNFMSRDLNQLKHHWTKKHSEQPFKAFRRKAPESHSTSFTQNQEKNMLPPAADTIDVDRCASKAKCETREADGEGNVEMIESLGNTIQNCPVCYKKVKTLKYLKVHMRVHGKGRYKCGYCSYISAYCLQVLVHCKKHHQHLQPCVKEHELDPLQDKNIVKNYDMFMDEVQKKGSKQPPDPDTRKWARKYSCPSCEYTCSYGASYRRHLTTHSKNPLPFRCQYCPFEGREKYYVRRHIQRIHRGFPAVVVDNNGEPPLRIPGAMNEQFLSISSPLRNLDPQKSLTKDLLKSKKSAKKPEVSTLVNVPAVEVSVSTRTNDQVKDRMIETFMGNPGITPSDVIIDALGTNNRLKNILGPNDCSILNVSREEEVRDGDSISPKLSEELNDHPTFSSPKSIKKQLKNHSSHQCIRNSPEVPKILPIQESVSGFPAVMKVNDSVEVDDNGVQEAVIVSDGLMPGREMAGINLVNLLNDVSTGNGESFGGQSSKGRDKSDVTLFKTKDTEDVKAKVEVIKTARKKGSKEKSSHKAWDFVAYRDGRYTFCVCGVRTVNKAFYKHIKKHIDSKRFGCGYCSYRSIERAKVRVHHTFVHPGLPLSVNELEDNAKEGLDNNPLKQSLTCSDKEAMSNQQSNQRKKASSSRLSPLFHCPICKKKISYHTYTIRRHLFSHCDYRPYKCGRCDFRGCSPGEVKQHSALHGADLCPIVQPSGQQIPEGLEQLVADCFNELQIKLGKKIRRRSKSNGKLINPIGQQMEKEGLNPNGYQLVTREASIWSQSLSTGVCPWCQVKITSSENGDILSHFKGHFYKTVGDSSSSECRFDEGGSSLPVYPSVSHEEKDAIVMNGLMYYVINQPLMKDSNDQKTSHGNQEDVFKGETGIINNPEGMPSGTIQVTDFLLADLRYLLWDHANESKLRKAQWHTCQKCKQQFRSSLTLKHHSKSHINRESTGMMEEEKQYDFQKQSTSHTDSQAPDGEVGVFLLGDDVEVATAVVVINSEAEEREMVLEISS